MYFRYINGIINSSPTLDAHCGDRKLMMAGDIFVWYNFLDFLLYY